MGLSLVAVASGRISKLVVLFNGLDELGENQADIIAFIIKIRAAKLTMARMRRGSNPESFTQHAKSRKTWWAACTTTLIHERRSISQIVTAKLVEDIAEKASGVLLQVAVVVDP